MLQKCVCSAVLGECSVSASWPSGLTVLCVFQVLLSFGNVVPPSVCAQEQFPANGLPEMHSGPLHPDCGPCQLTCDGWALLGTEHGPAGEGHQDPGPRPPRRRSRCPDRSAARPCALHEQLRPCSFSRVARGPATSIALQATTLFSLCSHSIQILSWSFRRGELNWLHPGVWVSAPGGVGTSVCGCCHKLPPTRGLKRQKSSARGSVSEDGRGLPGSRGPGPCSPHPFPDPDPPASPVPALPRQD